MIDHAGVEDLSDIVQVDLPWHGLMRRVALAVKRIVLSGAVGQTRDILSGDIIMGLAGETAVVIDSAWPVMRCEVTSGSFSVDDVVSVDGALSAATISAISDGENWEYRIVTDQGGIDRRLLVGHYDARLFRADALAWEFKRPGISPAPAATADEIAAGMEWRNSVLAPTGLGWLSGENINPMVDDAGVVWLISNVSGSTEPDRSGYISITVIPQPYLIIGEPAMDIEQCVTVFAAGEVPAGINNLGGVATWRLTGIKDQGRCWLYCIEGGNLPPGHLGGIVEVQISGVGVYDPGQPDGARFSGLIASIVVLKSYEECRPLITVTDDEQIPSITEITCAPDYLGEPANRLMSESLVCLRDITQIMIVSAWYDGSGAVMYPQIEIRHETESSAVLQYYYYGYCNYGIYVLINDHSYNLDASASIKRTYRLGIDGVYTTPIVHLHTVTQTHAGASDNSGSGTGEDKNYIDGVLVSESSYIGSFSPGGVNIPGLASWLHVCQGNPFEDGEEFGITLFASGSTTYTDSDVDYTAAQCCLATIGLQRDAANILRLVYAKSVNAAYTIDDFDTWPTGAYDLAVESGKIAGYASPLGIHAGGTLTTVDGIYGMFSGANSAVSVVHLQSLHPRFSAYNPHNDEIALASSVPVIFI